MGWLRTAGAAGFLAAQIAAAAAADMPGVPPTPPPRLVDLSSGWYLRGDIGYDWGTMSGAEAAPGFTSPINNSLGNGFLGGVGVGIKTKWLRTDVTIDYMAPINYSGTVVTSGDVTAKISAISALFNAYLDLGTWYSVTPYIGAGAGMSRVRVSDYSSLIAPPFSGGANNQWNFTWAVMGGIGYAVTPNLTVDLGYRFISLDGARTDSDAFGSMTFKDVAAHEVRLGLRWMFDDLMVER